MREGQGEFFRGEPPSFAQPDARSDRIGVIDVGSNSVRMVVFDGPCRTPAVLYNEKVLCGLGSELDRTGRLAPEGARRALRALSRFTALAPQLRVGALAGIATAAVREAADGPDFVEEVARRSGIRLRVVSGSEEAELAARGVLFGNPGAEGVVADLGGASLEFCWLAGGHAERGLTTPLGPLRLKARARRGAAIGAEIDRYLATVADSYRVSGGTLYLVGGAFRALARAQMHRTHYPLKVLHEYRLSADTALGLAEWVQHQRTDRLAAITGIGSGRAQHMAVSGRLLGALVRSLDPAWVQVSGFGLREGVCLENLAAGLRDEDALLAGAREQERRRARIPGFGEELGTWLADLLEPADAREDRLIRAAALLADVNWRTHPDYRAVACWETVTRINLTDLGHAGRAFLGLALVSRYKSLRKAAERTEAVALLSPAEQARATQLGLAMRLGGVLAGSGTGVLAYCPARRQDGRLVLTLSGPALPFSGEEVEKRVAALARAMDLDWQLTDTSDS
ncbi:Ppx/GppA family phosphatase [Paralimibaculum aggregatum]|uniref:Ppx/GppA family phosphatase n=2 Tax=Paralimibaculum aggregatum TaxID=3036245 RepID=A0ABQ6LE94_9RHOB|nr:Ppx/GppA family phosphatase [Limibaculum sp. NKW23]